MIDAMANYERYKPVGMKIKFMPNEGNTQSNVKGLFLVGDSNSDLSANPLSRIEAIQHRYFKSMKPG